MWGGSVFHVSPRFAGSSLGGALGSCIPPRFDIISGGAVVSTFPLSTHPKFLVEILDAPVMLVSFHTARGAVSLEWLEEDANGDLIYAFNRPWSDGTTGIKLSPLELLEKLAALVPLPRVHLVRYAGCLAPHSKLRDAIIPTPCQQGVDGEETKTGTPYWNSATAWQYVKTMSASLLIFLFQWS